MLILTKHKLMGIIVKDIKRPFCLQRGESSLCYLWWGGVYLPKSFISGEGRLLFLLWRNRLRGREDGKERYESFFFRKLCFFIPLVCGDGLMSVEVSYLLQIRKRFSFSLQTANSIDVH